MWTVGGRIHTGTQRTYRNLQIQTSFLWGDSAHHCITCIQSANPLFLLSIKAKYTTSRFHGSTVRKENGGREKIFSALISIRHTQRLVYFANTNWACLLSIVYIHFLIIFLLAHLQANLHWGVTLLFALQHNLRVCFQSQLLKGELCSLHMYLK